MAEGALKLPWTLLNESSCWTPTFEPLLQSNKAVESQEGLRCVSEIASLPFDPALKPEKTHICDFTFWAAQKQQMQNQRPFSSAFDRTVLNQGAANTDVSKNEEFVMVDSTKLVKGSRSKFIRRANNNLNNNANANKAKASSGGLNAGGVDRAGGQRSSISSRIQTRQNIQRIVGGKKDKLGLAYQQPRTQNNRWSNIRARQVASELLVDINSTEILTELPLTLLNSTLLDTKEIKIRDIEWRGITRQINSHYDKISRHNTVEIHVSHAHEAAREHSSEPAFTFVVPQTQDDFVLAENLQQSQELDVIMTDQILCTLMSSIQSRYPFQVYAYRLDNKLILDKPPPYRPNQDRNDGLRNNTQEGKLDKAYDSEDGITLLDLVHVNETVSDSVYVDTSNLFNAGVENAKINLAFQQMVIHGQPALQNFAEPAFADERQNDKFYPTNKTFRYRILSLPPGRVPPGCLPESRRRKPVQVAVRVEIDAGQVNEDSGEIEYVNLRALTEGSAKASLPWMQALDNQKGALLVTEMRNNACKMAKWIYQSMLGGVSRMKLGYIAKRAGKNVCVAVQTHRVADLAGQVGLKTPNAWGFVREIIDVLLADNREDGLYVITRDALTPNLKIHFKPLEEENSA